MSAGQDDAELRPHRENTIPMSLRSTLAQALSLALLRKPRSRLQPGGGVGFLLTSLVFLALGLVLDTMLVPEPRLFDPLTLAQRCFPLLLALVVGALLAWSNARPSLWLRSASLWLLAGMPVLLLLHAMRIEAADEPLTLHRWELAILTVYLLLLLLQMARHLGARLASLRLIAGVGTALAIVLAGALILPSTPWWWHWQEDAWQEASYPFSAERLMVVQSVRVEQALSAVLPQRPGITDLYLLAFAGDGGEAAFRNEAEFAARLFTQRFDASGRTLVLANTQADPDRHPLATLSNLRHALRGLAARMDVDEDVLLLFVTTHGSEDHELYVALEPLPLDQIAPADLREALDDAGIRYRVLVVSACYSGGFIDALESPDTLLITAARADRASFGCGPDADITWFGRAFLDQALNVESDFVAAFELASEAVQGMEDEAEHEASHPQIRVGERIAERLRLWRNGFTPGSKVPFEPRDTSP